MAFSSAALHDDPGWRPSTPDSVDADLATLWRDVGSHSPVSRAFMSNLVIVRRDTHDPKDGAVDDQTVDDVMQRHPARTLILRYTPEVTDTGQLASMRVTVRLFGDASRRYGAELIAAEAACAEAAIPSIVRRLILGGAPTAIWWNDDICDPMPPLSITTMGRQLLFDSVCWRDLKEGLAAAAAIMSRAHAPDLVDLNWRRLAPMREAVIHALRAVPGQAVLHPSNVAISHRRGETALAWLLAGWLHAALDWPEDLMPEVRETSASEGDRPGPASARLAIVLGTDQHWSLRATMTADHIAVDSASQPPFSMSIRQEPLGAAIADELTALSQDSAYAGALAALAGRNW